MARGFAHGGKRYKPVVAQVKERDGKGRPRVVELLYDEETVKVEEGMHFWVFFANALMWTGVKLN